MKGGASESKNDINAYQNNLRQENAKLRKLLSLQQKAIAFRRANLWTASDNSSRGCEDEDVSTSAAVDVSLLPEDSTVSSANKLFLQCIYCPKIFADASSFAKHISLRHLSSSIDDGLPKSLSSSGDNNNSSNSFMQRLQLQYQKVLEMKEAAASAAAAGNKSNDGNAEVINRLQMEIGQLKEKLAATEQALDEEKSARASFEIDLKQGLAGNVQQLQSELAAKIEEVRSLVIVARQSGSGGADDDGNADDGNANDGNADDAVDADVVQTKMAQEVPTESGTNDDADDDDDQPMNQNKVAPTPATASELKQTLRLQLISQLTAKRPESSASSEVHQQQIEPAQETATFEDSRSNKELTKAEISTSVESRLREYLQQRASVDENVTEVEPMPTTLPPTSLHSASVLDDSKFGAAMNKVHRDRELLIQQSRHDYDFVAIESSLRELIDSKLRSKLKAAEDTVEVQPVKEEEEGNVQHDHQPLPSAPPPDNDDDDDEHEAPSEPLQSSELQQQQQQQKPVTLKSILKSPRKAGARPKTRRRSFDENGDNQSSVKSNSRRISFSEQIIEFPISPRESEGDDSDDADNDADLGFVVGNVPANSTRRNQMFVIRSLDGGDDYDDRADRAEMFSSSKQLQSSPLADSFAREKIFINEYSTSSSSSSSEEEEEVMKMKSASAPLPAKAISNDQEVVVEVHQQPQASKSPIPAARKSKPSTLDSLLLGDDLPPPPVAGPTAEPVKELPSPSSSTRVQELADLIEKKLQQKQRITGSAMQGAVDTVASLRPLPSTKGVDVDYDIYDF